MLLCVSPEPFGRKVRAGMEWRANTVENKEWEAQLNRMLKKGIGLYLEKKPSTPEEIANACSVCEEGSAYMPDFVLDEDGSLKEVRYDKVKFR